MQGTHFRVPVCSDLVFGLGLHRVQGLGASIVTNDDSNRSLQRSWVCIGAIEGNVKA